MDVSQLITSLKRKEEYSLQEQYPNVPFADSMGPDLGVCMGFSEKSLEEARKLIQGTHIS